MDHRTITKSIDVDRLLIEYFESDLLMLFSLSAVSKLHRTICREKYKPLFEIFSNFISEFKISKDEKKKMENFKQQSIILMCKHSVGNGNLYLVKWMINHNYCPDFYKTYGLSV